MCQDMEIKKYRDLLKESVDGVFVAGTTDGEMAYLARIEGLSAYISSYDVQQMKKLNLILAGSTVILALATVVLAYFIYLGL